MSAQSLAAMYGVSEEEAESWYEKGLFDRGRLTSDQIQAARDLAEARPDLFRAAVEQDVAERGRTSIIRCYEIMLGVHS